MTDLVGDSYKSADPLVIDSTRFKVNKDPKSEFYCFGAAWANFVLWERVILGWIKSIL